MPVGFSSYEIARTGLFVNERGLNVTGHNIANVNTPGYVRQQAMITNGAYQNQHTKTGMYQLGLGADIQQIRQIRHAFLDNIYRQENTTLGYWEARSKTFEDVQAILGEPMGDGVQSVMNQFWDSWQELSKEPDSLTVRALVRQRGEALVHQVNHVGEQLDRLQRDLNSEIRVRIDEVNQLTGKIAELNVDIMKIEASNDTANDLRDQRNMALDRLTKLVDAQVNEMQDGQVDITAGGYFLVSKGVQTRLYAGDSEDGDMFSVPKIEGDDIDVPLRSGTIKGLIDSRGIEGKGIVADLKSKLNYLVRTMFEEVNKLHKSGKTLKGEDGDNFFSVIDSAYAPGMGNIKLDDKLIELDSIVGSASTASGDNTIALKIADIRHQPLMLDNNGIVNTDDFYQAIILDVGNGGLDAQKISGNQSKLVESAEAQRQAISGVSMDEEMTNMMKYKFAYDAASRAINVIDEMMGTVIERMGLVGR